MLLCCCFASALLCAQLDYFFAISSPWRLAEVFLLHLFLIFIIHHPLLCCRSRCPTIIIDYFASGDSAEQPNLPLCSCPYSGGSLFSIMSLNASRETYCFFHAVPMFFHQNYVITFKLVLNPDTKKNGSKQYILCKTLQSYATFIFGTEFLLKFLKMKKFAFLNRYDINIYEES